MTLQDWRSFIVFEINNFFYHLNVLHKYQRFQSNWLINIDGIYVEYFEVHFIEIDRKNVLKHKID